MPAFGPIKQRELIKELRKAGFEGPISGGKHPFMIRGDFILTIPNPHRGDIGRELLSRILKQAGMTREEWEAL
ncbi:MAG: type II toxin-antitoxin system HicA family toxin [Verrucomicrobiota bacterium]